MYWSQWQQKVCVEEQSKDRLRPKVFFSGTCVVSSLSDTKSLFQSLVALEEERRTFYMIYLYSELFWSTVYCIWFFPLDQHRALLWGGDFSMRIFGCRYLTPDWKCNYECPAGYWERGTEEIGGTCELLTSKRDVSLDSGPTLGDQRGFNSDFGVHHGILYQYQSI